MRNASALPCPRRTLRWLTAAVLAMVVLSVVGQVVRYRAENETVRRVALLFKLSAEHTIPAYASAAMLLGSALLLWTIARQTRASGQPFARHWAFLGVIFACLSVDEALALHERAIEPMQRLMGGYAVGFLHYAWVVPAAGLVLAVGVAYLRFLLHLDATVRNRVILAAALYVGGAIGMEMVGANFASTIGTSSLRYALSAVIEETMEMMGVVVFIHGLLAHLHVRLGVGQGAEPTASAASTAEETIPAQGFRGYRRGRAAAPSHAAGAAAEHLWNEVRSTPTMPPPDGR